MWLRGPQDIARVPRRRINAIALLGTLLCVPGAVPAGVKFGDAVPAIVKAADLERIRRHLGLQRFSVIAAVLLGATEGRELVIAEPLSDETLSTIIEACEGGGFCPDPLGFLASRVRILVLRGTSVNAILHADREVRGTGGRLFDLDEYGVEGRLIGWNGWAEEASGHPSVALTPITVNQEGCVGIGADPPFTIQWNEGVRRFQLYECGLDEDGRMHCVFEDEIPD
jgi:hypothetical protein